MARKMKRSVLTEPEIVITKTKSEVTTALIFLLIPQYKNIKMADTLAAIPFSLKKTPFVSG
jgi:hypothetical protein